MLSTGVLLFRKSPEAPPKPPPSPPEAEVESEIGSAGPKLAAKKPVYERTNRFETGSFFSLDVEGMSQPLLATNWEPEVPLSQSLDKQFEQLKIAMTGKIAKIVSNQPPAVQDKIGENL